MIRRLLTALPIATLALTLATATALAGGWAEVRPDASTTTEPGEGEPIVLGFTVLQHSVDARVVGDPDRPPRRPQQRRDARCPRPQVGAEGHFEATHPAADRRLLDVVRVVPGARERRARQHRRRAHPPMGPCRRSRRPTPSWRHRAATKAVRSGRRPGRSRANSTTSGRPRAAARLRRSTDRPGRGHHRGARCAGRRSSPTASGGPHPGDAGRRPAPGGPGRRP